MHLNSPFKAVESENNLLDVSRFIKCVLHGSQSSTSSSSSSSEPHSMSTEQAINVRVTLPIPLLHSRGRLKLLDMFPQLRVL